MSDYLATDSIIEPVSSELLTNPLKIKLAANFELELPDLIVRRLYKHLCDGALLSLVLIYKSKC